MRRENQTMVDQIPWDTCVIALIPVFLKRNFKKALLSVLKCVASSPTPQYNVETLEK